VCVLSALFSLSFFVRFYKPFAADRRRTIKQELETEEPERGQKRAHKSHNSTRFRTRNYSPIRNYMFSFPFCWPALSLCVRVCLRVLLLLLLLFRVDRLFISLLVCCFYFSLFLVCLSRDFVRRNTAKETLCITTTWHCLIDSFVLISSCCWLLLLWFFFFFLLFAWFHFLLVLIFFFKQLFSVDQSSSRLDKTDIWRFLQSAGFSFRLSCFSCFVSTHTFFFLLAFSSVSASPWVIRHLDSKTRFFLF
jgi:hypothetical protein